MKMNNSTLSLFGTISKFRAFADAIRLAFSVRIIAEMPGMYNENIFQEKLQIRYANLRV